VNPERAVGTLDKQVHYESKSKAFLNGRREKKYTLVDEAGGTKPGEAHWSHGLEEVEAIYIHVFVSAVLMAVWKTVHISI
jgi:hypothetical protein